MLSALNFEVAGERADHVSALCFESLPLSAVSIMFAGHELAFLDLI